METGCANIVSLDKWMNLGSWIFYNAVLPRTNIYYTHGQQKREAFYNWKTPSLATWLEKEIDNISLLFPFFDGTPKT